MPKTAAAVVACALLAACTTSDGSLDERLLRVRQLQRSGQIDEALPILRELIDEGDRSGEVMYRYGRALSLAGQPGRGIWALEEAQKHEDWFVQASHQIALDAHMGGNHETALEALERLETERKDPHEQDLPAQMLELRVRIDTRRMYDEALALADEILEREPDNEQVLRLKAVALLGLKQPDAAYEIISSAGVPPDVEAADESPDDDLLAGLAEPGDAAVDTDAKEPNPLEVARQEMRDAYWCTVRVTFKREAGELSEAERILDECLSKFPADTGLLNEMGKIYPQVGRVDDIENALIAAIESEPNNENIRMTYVRLLDESQRVDEAESVLRDAIDAARSSEKDRAGRDAAILAKRLTDLGAFLVDHDRGEEGIEFFAEAIELLGTQAPPELMLRQAEAMIFAGQYDEALEVAERIDVAVYEYMIRGRIAFERADYETAIKELNEVARLWPNHAPTRYYLARAREGVADFDRAIEEYRQAIRTDAALSAPRERLARLHLAEERVRQAATILGFSSPKKQSKPSGAMRLLLIETTVRQGRMPNLALPPSDDLSAREFRRGAVRAIARGVAAIAVPSDAEALLEDFQQRFGSSGTEDLFVRERVDLLIEADLTERALEIARAHSERSKHPDARIALGHALVAAGQNLEEAQSLLEGAEAEQVDDDGRLVTAIGKLHERRGDLPQARAAYERALSIDEGHWPAMDGLTRTLLASDRKDEALRRLSSFLDRDNPYEGRASLRYAQLLPDGTVEAERVRFAERALRFGAGVPAYDYLTKIDPTAAGRYRVEVVEPERLSPLPDALETAGAEEPTG